MHKNKKAETKKSRRPEVPGRYGVPDVRLTLVKNESSADGAVRLWVKQWKQSA